MERRESGRRFYDVVMLVRLRGGTFDFRGGTKGDAELWFGFIFHLFVTANRSRTKERYIGVMWGNRYKRH